MSKMKKLGNIAGKSLFKNDNRGKYIGNLCTKKRRCAEKTGRICSKRERASAEQKKPGQRKSLQ